MPEMLRSRRFAPIARVADHREQAAAKEFGQRQDVLAAQELRLAELRAWWREYAQGLEGQAGGGGRMMREGRLFLAQLTDAIERQQGVVESPTFRPISATGMVASRCRSVRIFRSILSNAISIS